MSYTPDQSNINGFFFQQPNFGPRSQPTLSPEQKEKKRLRGDANYVGGMMLVMTAVMQVFFPLVLLLLVALGVITIEQMYSDPFYGLGNTAFLLVYAGAYIVSILFPTVLVALCCKRRHFPLSPAKPVAAGDAFFGVLATMGTCVIANFVASYVAAFFEQFGISMPEMPEMMVRTPESLILNLIVIAVLPALLEELVFRGYVLRALRPYGDWFAVVVSAVLFGLMHGNILQIPFALLVGIALGWLYVMTDNIWLPVAVHFCNNAMSTLLDFLSMDMGEEAKGIYFTLVLLAIAVTGGVAFVVLLVQRSDLFRRLPCQSLLPVRKRIGSLICSPLFIISVIVFAILTVIGSL